MGSRKCFGTLLWDAADEQCRACDDFADCREALRDASQSIAFAPEGSAEASPDARQAAIEKAFDNGAATVARNANGGSNVSAAGSASPKKLVHFSTRLPEGLEVDLKVYCALNKMTVQTFMAEAVRDRLKK